MSLGDFIKETRKQKELSQDDVAKKADIARSYISRIEDNQFKMPSAMLLIRLAKALEVNHDELFQAAGYLPKIKKDNLPSFSAYLRTKYPQLSGKAVKNLESLKELIEQKESEKS